MKKVFIPSVVASALLIGCGGGSSNNTSLKEVKVIDAYIVNAKVCDGKGICALTDADGVARAAFDLNTPLTSIGGFIDANFNGKLDSDELSAPMLTAPAGASVITPLTTLVANGADIDKLSKLLGVTPDDILHTDPIETNNITLVKAFNAIYPVIKEDKIEDLVSKVNAYNPNYNSVQTDLPVFDNTAVSVNIFYLAKSVLTNPADRTFVEEVEKTNGYDAKSLSENLETLKENITNLAINIPSTTTQTTQEVATQPTTTTSETTTTSVATTPTTPTTTTTSTSSTVTTTTSTGTDLPDFNANYQPTTVSLTSVNTDLPTFDSENVELIPTNNTYNPSYTPLPPIYYIKLNSFNKFVELKKLDDKNYEFLNEEYFNVLNQEFNATKFFDINASYVFNDLNFTPDGGLDGTIFVNLKDLNDSSEVNFTIKNVKFIVLNQKVINTDLRSVIIDINSTTNNAQKNINDRIYTQFDINLSRVLVDYNESEFNQTNHDYQFKIDYNISNTHLDLSGKYGIINITPPAISLNETSYIVPQNSDINISVGTSNIPNVSCSVDGVSGLYCYVDSAKNIYLYGHTPNEEAIRVVTLTLDNRGYKDSKSLYLEILKPADKIIVQNWDLMDANYSGYHIEMNLTGSLDNNIIDVNTSATPVVGSPENNVTVYLFNSSTDTNNYIRFTFDVNVYHSNDWFIIRRGDNKEVRFRVGDVDISNNTFYFK